MSDEFYSRVDALVALEGHLDGGDLCFNLVESGVIPTDATPAEAANIVIQHMEQP